MAELSCKPFLGTIGDADFLSKDSTRKGSNGSVWLILSKDSHPCLAPHPETIPVTTARSSILEVARHAGVSIATVSRVLRGTTFVSEETREKVMAAVAALEFQPNRAAQELRSGRGSMVALLVGDIEQGIYPALTRHIQAAYEEIGLDILLYNLGHRQERLEAILARAAAMRLRGLVIATSDALDMKRLEQPLSALRRERVPVLSVGQALDEFGIPSILHNECMSVVVSVRHLIDTYGPSVAFIGRITGSIFGSERYRGYRLALQQKAIPFDKKLVWDASFRFAASYEAIRKALAEGVRFRALQASSDELALGAMSAIQQHGLKIPDDVAVIGVGDVDWSAHVFPSLTTLGGHSQTIAAKLREILTDIEAGRASPSSIVFDRPFVRRGSA